MFEYEKFFSLSTHYNLELNMKQPAPVKYSLRLYIWDGNLNLLAFVAAPVIKDIVIFS